MKEIIGPRLLVPGSFEVDTKECTDLIVMRARDMRIGCLVRRPGFAERYGNEFTIRSHRKSGVETEASKVDKGWGDWMFYGHADPYKDGRVCLWMIIDLSNFRYHCHHHGSVLKFVERDNPDGITSFIAFDVTSFPPDPPLLIAHSNQ